MKGIEDKKAASLGNKLMANTTITELDLSSEHKKQHTNYRVSQNLLASVSHLISECGENFPRISHPSQK